MSNNTTSNPKNQSRANELFSEIVASFVSRLEAGENPFKFGRQSPVNANTNNPYSGLNKLILSYYAALNGYKSNKWLTMKQVSTKKGKVTKGEKATPVFFFQDSYAVKVVKDGKETTVWSRKKTIEEAKAEVLGKKGVTSVISASKKMVLKHYYVFNYEQTDLVDENQIPVPEQPMALRQAVSSHVRLADGKTLFYSEQDDTIYGALESFSSEAFFKAAIEATKTKKRLDRELEYPEEELVKLIGSSYLMGACSLSQSVIAPELATIFISKLKASPNSLWKYARYADRAYGMISTWIEELKQTREVA
jgi:antirestriction protein ArdC